MSITDIAHAHGFESSAHFARKFGDADGATPSSIRGPTHSGVEWDEGS